MMSMVDSNPNYSVASVGMISDAGSLSHRASAVKSIATLSIMLITLFDILGRVQGRTIRSPLLNAMCIPVWPREVSDSPCGINHIRRCTFCCLSRAEQLVAHRAHNAKVAGSSPAPASNPRGDLRHSSGISDCRGRAAKGPRGLFCLTFRAALPAWPTVTGSGRNRGAAGFDGRSSCSFI